MTVYELSNDSRFTVLSMPDPEREIKGAYIGDLLSWVMGRAQEDNVWFTIMSNINVVAVASLADVSCVVLTEGVTLSPEVLDTAKQKGVNILSTELTTFDAAVFVSGSV